MTDVVFVHVSASKYEDGYHFMMYGNYGLLFHEAKLASLTCHKTGCDHGNTDCSLLTILLLAQMSKLYKLYFSPVYYRYINIVTVLSHSTVLRDSCLFVIQLYLYICHLRSGLSATVIKEYCIVLYCTKKFPVKHDVFFCRGS